MSGRVFVDISMSLDGFITGPNVPVLVGDGRRLFEDLGTEQIELEGTRVIDSKDVIHLQFRPPKTKEKKGGAS